MSNSITRILPVLVLASIGAFAHAQRCSIEGKPSTADPIQVVNKMILNTATGVTTSPSSFGIRNNYTTLRVKTVASLFVPHSGNMHLSFVGTTKAYYVGDARQTVCKAVNSYGGDWRTVPGTMKLEITTLSTGRKRVKASFTPAAGNANAQYAVSGVIFDKVLNHGDVAFRFNY